MYVNLMIIGMTIVIFIILLIPRVRTSELWRASITPLASIIGSGFLISGPITTEISGRYAVVLIAILVAFAYLIGSAIRYNILYVQPNLRSGQVGKTVLRIERVSDWSLAFAYIISITFYVKLFAAFSLHYAHFDEKIYQDLLATAVLIFIGGYGYNKGLHTLENFEAIAVTIKLSIIAGFLTGLAIFNYSYWQNGAGVLSNGGDHFDLNTIRMALGCFIMIQGFETSRYLDSEYSANIRVKSMRISQFVSSVIYIAFISLGLVLFLPNDIPVSETAVIDFSAIVASSLPLLLIIAALGAQFSAAVADVLGAGGLLNELSKLKIHVRQSYLIVVGLSISFVWLTDVFEIIAFASKGFAFYYGLQCYQVFYNILKRKDCAFRPFKMLGFLTLSIICMGIVIFAIPIE